MKPLLLPVYLGMQEEHHHTQQRQLSRSSSLSRRITALLTVTRHSGTGFTNTRIPMQMKAPTGFIILILSTVKAMKFRRWIWGIWNEGQWRRYLIMLIRKWL